jgi:hypothetical protein
VVRDTNLGNTSYSNNPKTSVELPKLIQIWAI